MKKLVISIFISIFVVSIANAGFYGGGGGGTGDMAKSTYDTNADSMVDADKVNAGIDAAKIGGGGVSTTEFGYIGGLTSDAQIQITAQIPKSTIAAAGDILVGIAASTPGVITKGAANTIFGVNASNVLGFYGNIQQDDSAAVMRNAVDATKLWKPSLTGMTTGKTATWAINFTDDKTLNFPDPTTGDSVAYGSAAIRFNTGGATARVWTVPDAAVTIPANPIGGTLGATTNVIPKANGTGTATLQASGITEDGTKVDIGTLNFVTTGQSSGRIVVVSDADGKTLSGTDLYGSMQLATGAGTWTIPDVDSAAGTGQCFCVYVTGAYEVTIAGDAEDKIRLAGTLGAAGGDITNNTAEAAGDFICLMLTDFAANVAHWTTLGYKGTWTVVP